jgi:hypothetical protein
MESNNPKRTLTKDFVSLIVNDMRHPERQDDFIRNSVDYSGLEHQNIQNRINHLLAVKEAIHRMNLIINDYCIDQIQALRKSVQRKTIEIDFIDTIDTRAIIKKRDAALLCERSESWLQKGDHKDRFENQKNGGVNVLSFANYLKENKPYEYQVFVRNYKKRINSKIG